jgi:hypothetical protein
MPYSNLHLLFWLSLVPFVTRWMGENHFAPVPTALYGVILLLAGIAYRLLQRTILLQEGPGSTLAAAVGSDWKGRTSLLTYGVAIPLALLRPWMAGILYVAGVFPWLVPDRRIERKVSHAGQEVVTAGERCKIPPQPSIEAGEDFSCKGPARAGECLALVHADVGVCHNRGEIVGVGTRTLGAAPSIRLEPSDHRLTAWG